MRGLGTLLPVCLAISFQLSCGSLEVGLPSGGGLYILRMYIPTIQVYLRTMGVWCLHGYFVERLCLPSPVTSVMQVSL